MFIILTLTKHSIRNTILTLAKASLEMASVLCDMDSARLWEHSSEFLVLDDMIAFQSFGKFVSCHVHVCHVHESSLRLILICILVHHHAGGSGSSIHERSLQILGSFSAHPSGKEWLTLTL